MLSDGICRHRPASAGIPRLNALSSIVCFLTKRERGPDARRTPESQCPLEHCMLSDELKEAISHLSTNLGLNALSSIVCFLTSILRKYSFTERTSLNALSSIVCFLTNHPAGHHADSRPRSLNALSSIVCFLTKTDTQKAYSRAFAVSMPSRALYAF